MQQAPSDWFEPMVLPLIATFFGVLLYAIGAMRERNSGGTVLWKWAGVVICLFGIYAAWPYFSAYANVGGDPTINAMYKAAADGKKMAIGHIVAFVGPLLGIAGCVVFHFLQKKWALGDD